MPNTCVTYFLTTRIKKELERIYKNKKILKTIEETYYDTDSFFLLKNGILLFTRGEKFIIQKYEGNKGTDKMQYTFKVVQNDILIYLNKIFSYTNLDISFRSFIDVKRFFINTISININRSKINNGLVLDIYKWILNGKTVVYPVLLCNEVEEKFNLRKISSLLIRVPDRYEAYVAIVCPDRLKFINQGLRDHFMKNTERIVTYSIEENPFKE